MKRRNIRDLPSDRCLSFEEGFPDLDIVSPSPPWPYTQTLWDEREGIVLVLLLLANPFQIYIRQPSSSSSEVETCERACPLLDKDITSWFGSFGRFLRSWACISPGALRRNNPCNLATKPQKARSNYYCNIQSCISRGSLRPKTKLTTKQQQASPYIAPTTTSIDSRWRFKNRCLLRDVNNATKKSQEQINLSGASHHLRSCAHVPFTPSNSMVQAHSLDKHIQICR